MRFSLMHSRIALLCCTFLLSMNTTWAQATENADPARLAVIDYAVIFVYFAVLVWMGFYFAKRESSTDAFFLGGRKIPWWAVGISIFGTSLSAITYIAIPASAFAGNWVGGLFNMGILLIAPFVALVYIPRLLTHPYSTAYEYLEKRFNLPTRIYGSLCFAIFQLGRMSIVLYLPAIAMAAATGIDIYFCIITMGIMATLYTVLGGIEAVIWTDVIQSVVLLIGAILALIMIIMKIDGGLPVMIEMANAENKMHFATWSWDVYSAGVLVVVVGGTFSAAYPVMADQTVVQRYLSTSSPKEAAKALWVNAAMTLPMQLLFFGMGTALWVYYTTHPGELPADLQSDAIVPFFVIQHFPMGLKGLLIAGLFAASMSSLDSSMNSLSSVLVNDYYKRFIPNVPEDRALLVARIITLALGVIGTAGAVYVATTNDTTLFDKFVKLLGFVGGGLSGIFALGTLTKRANGVGAFTGAVVSGVVMYFTSKTEIHFYLHPVIGCTTAFAVGYLVSVIIGGGKIDEKHELMQEVKEEA